MTAVPYCLLIPSRREARLTASPMTVYSKRWCEPMLPTMTSPLLMPMRMPRRGRPCGGEFVVQRHQLLLAAQGRAHGLGRLLLGGQRRPPEGHDGVALELVDEAAAAP